jgi:hypothetical protein
MMKKFIYCLMLGIWGVCSYAQLNKVTQGEYFWDTDPGEGSATALTAADGNFDNVIENALQNTATVPATSGLHVFNIRLKDNTGLWGPVFKNVVHIGNSVTTAYAILTQGEYFWDADPGEGSATALTAADGTFNAVLENVVQNTASVPATPGLHTFSVRIKDNTGNWGPVFTNIVHTGNLAAVSYATLVQAEYFWDVDPGEGSGTSLSAVDGSYGSVLEQILQSEIPIAQPMGFHVLNVRVKDNAGMWGPAFQNVVYVETTLGTGDFDPSKLIVYPNPVEDILNVSFDQQITSVSIFNVLGQQVMARPLNANEVQIDVSNLRTGTYFVKVTAANKVQTLKVIKQ